MLRNFALSNDRPFLRLKKEKEYVTVYIQEGQERGPKEPQISQLHLDTWKGDRANNPVNHFQTYIKDK